MGWGSFFVIFFLSVDSFASYLLPKPPPGRYIVSAWDKDQCGGVGLVDNFSCKTSPGGNCFGVAKVHHLLMTNRVKFNPDAPKDAEQAKKALVDAIVGNKQVTINGYKDRDEFIKEASGMWVVPKRADVPTTDLRDTTIAHPMQATAAEIQSIHVVHSLFHKWTKVPFAFSAGKAPIQTREDAMRAIKNAIDNGRTPQVSIRNAGGGHALLAVGYVAKPGEDLPEAILAVDPNRQSRPLDQITMENLTDPKELKPESLKVLRFTPKNWKNQTDWLYMPWYHLADEGEKAKKVFEEKREKSKKEYEEYPNLESAKEEEFYGNMVKIAEARKSYGFGVVKVSIGDEGESSGGPYYSYAPDLIEDMAFRAAFKVMQGCVQLQSRPELPLFKLNPAH